MVIRIHCRKPWLSALMRALRNEVLPLWMRQALIVVDRSGPCSMVQRGSRGQASTRVRLISACGA